MTIVLDMEGEIPDPQYFAFSIDQLDLWAVFEAATGVMKYAEEAREALNYVDAATASSAKGVSAVAHAGSEAIALLESQYKSLQPILGVVKFLDVAMHFADANVTLPDGTVATRGLGLRFTLDLFGLDLFAAFELSSGSPTKFAGLLTMDPIHVGSVISVTGDGKGVTAAAASSDAWQSTAVTRTRAQAPTDWRIKPGGPVLQVQSTRSPFLHASLDVKFFELALTVTADIDNTGFSFKLEESIGEAIRFELHCLLRTGKDFRFEAGGGLHVHVDGELGPIIPGLDFTKFHIDLGLDLNVDLTITGSEFHFRISGDFEFEGATLTLPTLDIDIEFDKVADLAKKVWDHLVSEAEHIFADLFANVGKALEEGVQAVEKVGKEAIAGVETLAKDAAGAIVAAAAEVEKGIATAEKDIEVVAADVRKTAEAVASAVKADIVAVEQVAEQAATAIAAEAEKIADETVKIVADIERTVVHDVEVVEHAIADIVNLAAHEVLKVAEEAEKVAGELLADAEGVARVLAADAEQVVRAVEQEVAVLEHEIEEFVEEAKRLAEAALHAVEHGVESVVSGVKHAARAVANWFSSWL